MKVKTISVTYGRKFNLGNYESVELSTTMWADVEDEDAAAVVSAKLWAHAKTEVKREAVPLLEQRKAGNNKHAEKFMGVEVE